MHKKNLLFIIPEMTMGGAQRSLTNISDALASFYAVQIVVFNRKASVFRESGVPILSLDVSSANNVVLKVLAFFKRIRRLRALKKKLNTDVSISFLEGADYINLLSKRGEKVILSIRGSKIHDENMQEHFFGLRTWLIAKLYRNADAIVCVNRGISRELKDYFHLPAPAIVINNFYDTGKIEAEKQEALSEPEIEFYSGPVIAMSGRLAVEKGNLFVLKVFAHLKRDLPAAKLLFIGDGSYRKEIEEVCAGNNLNFAYKESLSRNADVYITGAQHNVYKYLFRASVYVLNSSSEGFPNGLVEAMACGVPVMAADCPYGPREILSADVSHTPTAVVEKAEYGVLLPLGTDLTLPMWVNALTEMIAEDSLRTLYSRKGLERAGEFTEKKIIGQWLEVIDRNA